MTSKLKVKKRVKSNMPRTMGGQEMASRRMVTKPCMLDRKIFRDCAADTRGGKSNVDENTATYEAKFANPLVAAQRGFIDAVITPRETRQLVWESLELLSDKRQERAWRKHGNIPL